MADEFQYELSFAGVPLLLDRSKIVRLTPETDPVAGRVDPRELPPRKHQPESNLIEELDRKLPFHYFSEFAPPKLFLGRNLDAVAHSYEATCPNDRPRINEWWYPTGASRWSVFRGLATSSMVKEMVRIALTGGTTPQTFTMKSQPVGNPETGSYELSSSMYLLPPRPLAEHGGEFDGLYLVTLVDERYYWQWRGASNKVFWTDSWSSLISSIASTLGISVSPGTITAAYLSPEPDSQFWANRENAAILMDAAAANIGRVFVRKLDGTYALESTATSQAIVETNRGDARKVVRTAGGDMFLSGSSQLQAQNLNAAKNATFAASVDVSFPKYVEGDDPVPHLFNARYRNQRPSCWHEESYGDSHVINVPAYSGRVVSGRVAADGDIHVLSGFNGVGIHEVRSTAKAIISGEVQVEPLNVSGLTALAMQLAYDYYAFQAIGALDEVYPGTYAWTPEGINDIVWTYGGNLRQATCRVFRSEWNQMVHEFQHSTPPAAFAGSPAGQTDTDTPRGVGGPSVAQTHRDQYGWFSGILPVPTLASPLTSGGYTASFSAVDNLPTQNRWRGRINNEKMLFEGTSGGTSVGIVWRGIDGTIQTAHTGGSIYWLIDDHAYGVNLVTEGEQGWAHPGVWSSGGISEAVRLQVSRSVICMAGSGEAINSLHHWSGLVLRYDTTKASGSQFPQRERIWITERNGLPLRSGIRYDGQLVGYSATFGGVTVPVYVVNEVRVSSGQIASGSIDWYNLADNSVRNNHLASGSVASGKIASGTVEWYYMSDDSVRENHLASGSVTSGSIASGQIGKNHLSPGAVTGANLESGSVQSGHIGNAAVTSGNIASGAITGMHIATNSITNVQIGVAAVGPSELQLNTVASGYIVSGQVGWPHLASGCVRSGHIGNAAVVSGSVASGAIAWAHLSSGCVRSGRIADLAVNSGNISSGQIGKPHIASGAVGSGQLSVTGSPDGTKVLRDDFSWAAKAAIVECRVGDQDNYVALYCVESPEVRFDDFIRTKLTSTEATIPIDPIYLRVCDDFSITPIGYSAEEPVTLGVQVDSHQVRIKVPHGTKLPLNVTIHLTGIRRGMSGRFIRHTKEDMVKNTKFWNKWKEA